MGTIELDMTGAVPLDERDKEVGDGVSATADSDKHENYHVIDYFLACQDRAAILAGFLRFAQPLFATVVVFSVQAKCIRYLNGHGENLHGPSMLTVPIAWMDGVLIRRIITQRMPYQGAIPVDIEEKQMLAQFLKDLPSTCWLYPVAIGDGVDCLIYADTPKMVPRMATQRLEFALGKMVLALRRLLVEHLLVHG